MTFANDCRKLDSDTIATKQPCELNSNPTLILDLPTRLLLSPGRPMGGCKGTNMRSILIVGAMAALLAGCQTAQESMADAEVTCESQGFRPGTRAYQQCRSANYVENRRASNEAGSAVAAGVAAGVVGGAIAASADRHYYRGYGYYGPRRYWW
jgi:hypothetical protein